MFNRDLLFYDTLEIELGFNCNLKCWKCNCLSRHRTPDEFYDFETLKKDLQYIFSLKDSNKIRQINLTGGDPFLYYKLKELVVFLRRFNTPIVILTNGILLSKFKDFLVEDFNVDNKNHNVISITDYNIKGVRDFIKNNKKLNICVNTYNGFDKPWVNFVFRPKLYNSFLTHAACCKTINLYNSNIYYCYVVRNFEKFVEKDLFKNDKRDLYSFDSISSMLDFLTRRSKICNCCFGSKSTWSLKPYEISDVIKK